MADFIVRLSSPLVTLYAVKATRAAEIIRCSLGVTDARVVQLMGRAMLGSALKMVKSQGPYSPDDVTLRFESSLQVSSDSAPGGGAASSTTRSSNGLSLLCYRCQKPDGNGDASVCCNVKLADTKLSPQWNGLISPLAKVSWQSMELVTHIAWYERSRLITAAVDEGDVTSEVAFEMARGDPTSSLRMSVDLSRDDESSVAFCGGIAIQKNRNPRSRLLPPTPPLPTLVWKWMRSFVYSPPPLIHTPSPWASYKEVRLASKTLIYRRYFLVIHRLKA